MYMTKSKYLNDLESNNMYRIIMSKDELLRQRNQLLKEGEQLNQQIKEIDRERIIDISESLFNKNGIESTSMTMIARTVGMSKGSLYNHFFNRKEDLLLEIAIRAYKQLISMFQEAALVTNPGIEQVSEMGRQYYYFASKYPLYRHTFDITGQLSNLDSLKKRKNNEQLHRSVEIIERLHKEQGKFIEFFTKIIKKAQDLDEITKKYNAMQLAFILGTISTGLADELIDRMEWAKQVGLTIDQVLEISIGFLHDGIKPKKLEKEN